MEPQWVLSSLYSSHSSEENLVFLKDKKIPAAVI